MVMSGSIPWHLEVETSTYRASLGQMEVNIDEEREAILKLLVGH